MHLDKMVLLVTTEKRFYLLKRQDQLINILLIEDDRIDAKWVERSLLSDEKKRFRLDWKNTLQVGIEALNNNSYQVIISDLNLPDGYGLEIYSSIQKAAIGVPIIFLTGELNEEKVAIEALTIGAQDYLIKGKTDAAGLIRSIFYALERQALLNLIQKKNQELDSFAHIVTHDLRSPVMSILQLIEMIEEDEGNHFTPESKDLFERVVRSGNRLDELVKGIYEFYCVNEDSSDWAEFNLKDAAQVAVDGLEAMIKKKGAVITISEMPTLRILPALLAQVFLNLISNAMKYCQSVPEIEIFSKRLENQWVIGVKDNGLGIEEKNKELVFQMLKRLHRQEEYDGRGVGLATCKKIIEFHKGEIWVESVYGNGSTFYFSLPI